VRPGYWYCQSCDLISDDPRESRPEDCKVVWIAEPITDEDHERGITLTGRLAGHHWSTDRIIDLLAQGGKIREAMEQELRLRGAKLDEGTLPFDIEKT
jgi:hypothetical protein